MTIPKRIYIAGCGGMLGEAFHKTFSTESVLKCTDIDVNESWLTYLDFRNFDDYRKDVAEFRPDWLFHLGAHTDLEYCELNPEDAYMTNTISVENAVFIANELNIPLLYISTAGIFDGKKEFYDDWDLPNPLGHYARAKYAGEAIVRENTVRHLVCRAGWMMGGGPRKDKKFIHKIMKQLKDGRQTIHVVNDKLGTPTYTHDFAQNVKLLLEKEYWGLYNMVCEGVTSRLEVAHEMVRLLGLQSQIRIVEVGSEHFKEEYFAERPPSERLMNRRLNLRNLNSMRHWKVGLQEYLESYYKGFLEAN
jgi:dTDP-4-dehydrorhamnose reductase